MILSITALDAECYYAQCRVFVVVLSVIRPNAIILSIVALFIINMNKAWAQCNKRFYFVMYGFS